MIRKTALFLIIQGISTFVNGQVNKFDIGIEGGPSLTSIRGNDFLAEFQYPTIGYSGGLSLQYNFPKLVSIRTNISYERKGVVAKFNATDINGSVIGEIKTHTFFDYLTIPLLTRFNFGSKIKFFINAGPYFGYLIKNTNITEEFNEFPEYISENTDDYQKFDFGLTGGLGCMLPIKNNFSLSLEIRNNLGLKNINQGIVFDDVQILMNSTNLLIGFAYRLGKRIEIEK